MAIPLGILNLHKIGNAQKVIESHVIKFQVLSLIINQYKLKANSKKYFIQHKYKYYFSCCRTLYILNTLQIHPFNWHPCMHTLDCVLVEPESEIQEAQVWEVG
jgi:hypothetical protein